MTITDSINRLKETTHRAINSSVLFSLFFLTLFTNGKCYADDDLWQFDNTVKTYYQDYSGTPDRSSTYNAGYMLSASYLDTGQLRFGYNYTSVSLGNNADVTENMFYISGLYHRYPDSLPGKLSFRFDIYSGEDKLKYNINTPPDTTPGPGPGPGPGKPKSKTYRAATDIVSESTSIYAYFAQLAFINYKKTFYTDIGYAQSEYDASAKTDVAQLTPSVGFGWNNSYDWLHFRAYVIRLDQTVTTYESDSYDSLEAKYTHWFADEAASSIEYIRVSLLSGENLLAIDPDIAAIYSNTDIRTSSISVSVQWKLSGNRKVLAAAQYDQYRAPDLGDNFDSLLFYLNLQFLNK